MLLLLLSCLSVKIMVYGRVVHGMYTKLFPASWKVVGKPHPQHLGADQEDIITDHKIYF